MEKNSSTYNNKRFAQRTDNYADYERNTSIPVPPARAQNWIDFMALGAGGFMKEEGGEEIYYPNSISNAKSFIDSSIYKNDSKFTEEINKFMSYMKMLNNGQDAKSDQPKVSWLGKNRRPKDQYDEFTNWSQSERQKYSSRFETMIGTKRGAILQKALVALKNAEIAAAKYSFPNDPGAKAATYMSEAAVSEKPSAPSTTDSGSSGSSGSSSQSSKPSSRDNQGPISSKPKPPKFNYSYMKSIKYIKNANDLVYHAAKRALGLKQSDVNEFYTSDNAPKIKSEIIKIADSDYMNKINPKLRKLKQEALDKLLDKTLLNIKPTPQPDLPEETGAGTAGPMPTTTGPDGEQKVSSPVQTEAGDEIRELLDTAEGLDNNQLKRLWKNMLNRIDVLLRNPQIDNLEKVEFDQRLKDIILRYNLAFHPEGGRQLASGAFVVNTPEVVSRILLQALKVNDTETANKAVDQLKIMFDDNPEHVPYQQIRASLKQKINKHNFDADEMVNNF
jgi:hypothetical protein